MDSTISYVPTTKEKPGLMYKNFVYQNRSFRGDKTYWRCEKSREKGILCPATCMTKKSSEGHDILEKTINIDVHNHSPVKQSDLQFRIMKYNIKKRARKETDIKIKRIFVEEMKKFKDNNLKIDLETGKFAPKYKS